MNDVGIVTDEDDLDGFALGELLRKIWSLLSVATADFGSSEEKVKDEDGSGSPEATATPLSRRRVEIGTLRTVGFRVFLITADAICIKEELQGNWELCSSEG